MKLFYPFTHIIIIKLNITIKLMKIKGKLDETIPFGHIRHVRESDGKLLITTQIPKDYTSIRSFYLETENRKLYNEILNIPKLNQQK